MIDRRLFLGGCSMALVPAAWASIPADERVVRVLEATRGVDRRLPGMVGAIVKGASVAAIAAVGIRKIGSPEAFRPDDRVHLGSCTKAMTATMIGTLVEQEKLRWDSTFLDVFPALARTFHPDYQGVTLRQLLAHRAGLPRDVAWRELGAGRSATEQRRTLMRTVLRQPPKTRPGSTFDYSNVGYALAGLMAEEVGGAPWELLMRRRLFEPLGMTTAGFGPPGTRGKVDQPWGHRASGDLIEPTRDDNPPVLGPAGTVHCSLPDWARFASLHMDRKADPGGARLLAPETLKALHTPEPGEGYVAGWGTDRDRGGGDRDRNPGRGAAPATVLSHDGSNGSWYCSIRLFPDRDLAVLVATNAGTDDAAEACAEAIRGLLDLESFNNNDRRRKRP